MTLSKLLKLKADRGMRVLLLLWEEYRGLISTHEARTEEFFRGTRIFGLRSQNRPIWLIFRHIFS